jgi:hypothetical protein
MLKVWDVLSDTQYNTSTIIHGGNHERSQCEEPQSFSMGTTIVREGKANVRDSQRTFGQRRKSEIFKLPIKT